MSGLEILTVAQSAAVDAWCAAHGVATLTLMENAGRAVAEAAREAWPGRAVEVLCGPGGNGGDGYVAARLLLQAGAAVRLRALAPPSGGDAAAMAQAYGGPVAPFDAPLDPGALVIDALFGAGLARPLAGPAAAFAEASAGLCVLAVDVPSGLPGDGAAPAGPAVRAARTITFVRKKPAHLLLPGRASCGAVAVADIGAPDAAVAAQRPQTWENAPALWPDWPRAPDAASHKHARGKVAIWAHAAGPRPSQTLGAQRLAARAAQRLAGWVSVFCAIEDAPWFAEPAALVVRCDADCAGFDAIAFGSGAAPDGAARDAVARLARHGRPLVLDAGALSAEADLDAALGATPAVLTPHAGEFRRAFPAAAALPDKLAQARAAATAVGAVVLLKGADTVIAAPDGRAAINAHATPWLASAGTGDVLAGVIAGLLASGAAPFEAAAAGAWLHGEAGRRVGPGLIADDLIAALPGALAALRPPGPGD